VRNRLSSTLILSAMAVVTLLPTTAPAAGETEAKGKVTVVHAVPGLTVDVYANEGLFIEDFAPGTITAPVKLASGSYDIEITPANSDSVALSATAPVTEDTDAAAVAYLEEDGDPTLGLFANNQRPIDADKARVTVRHTAAAPEVDVRFKRIGGDWRHLTADLANGEQDGRGFVARKYRFDVVLAGTNTRVLGPVTLELAERKHYYVYAWGSAEDENLALNLSKRNLAAKG